ncbi:hypothetical protein HD806DRAFT_506254 [Xylariaceae sp. AK1471]|nr:hypothetical protein HD806DRAFT_506254 [Xylariaceae sp. AK1471]
MDVYINPAGLSHFDHRLRLPFLHKRSGPRAKYLNRSQQTSSPETTVVKWLVSCFIRTLKNLDWPIPDGPPSVHVDRFSEDGHQNYRTPLQNPIADAIKKSSNLLATGGPRSQGNVGSGQVPSRCFGFKGDLHNGDPSSYLPGSSSSSTETISLGHDSKYQSGGFKNIDTHQTSLAPLMNRGCDYQMNISRLNITSRNQGFMPESCNSYSWWNDHQHLSCQALDCSIEAELRDIPAFVKLMSIKLCGASKAKAMSDRKIKYIIIQRQGQPSSSAPVVSAWIYSTRMGSCRAPYDLNSASARVMISRDRQTIIGIQEQGRCNTTNKLQPLEIRTAFHVWSRSQQRSRDINAGNGTGSSTGGNAKSEKRSLLFPLSRPGEYTAKRNGQNPGKHEEEDKESDDIPGFQGPVTKRPRHEVTSRAFACPYYKLDPMNNHRCLNYKLAKISYVKQHLWRCHAGSQYYCPVCCQLFNHQQELDHHITAPGCESRQATFQCMTETQKKEIQGTTGRKITQEQKWYEIWTILFGPSTKKPASPYIEEHIFVEAISSIRTFCRESGSHLIMEALSQANGHELSVPELLDQVLENIQHQAIRYSTGSSSSNFNIDPPLNTATFQDDRNSDITSTIISDTGLTTSVNCVDECSGPACSSNSEVNDSETAETFIDSTQTMLSGPMHWSTEVNCLDNFTGRQDWSTSAFDLELPFEFPFHLGHIPDFASSSDRCSQSDLFPLTSGVADNVESLETSLLQDH